MKTPTPLKISNTENNNQLLSFRYLSESINKSEDVLVPLDVLAKSEGFGENWSDGDDVEVIKSKLGTMLCSKHHLVFICHSKSDDIKKLVTQVYQQAYQSSQELGYTYLVRTWNYLHDITGYENGLERYQSFCVARHEVLEQFEQLTAPNPAATAIGSYNGQNCFVFLFGKLPGTVIENRRQMPAWQYPKQYAPKQPRFSRAIVLGNVLMCSGTASVVGHETVHLNDLEAQFHECMNNISQLLLEHGNKFNIKTGCYRFYLRNKQKKAIVTKMIRESGITDFIVLHGDICRENLLIECEVVFQ